MVSKEATSRLELPTFTLGGVFRETPHFRVVMDWKPGMEGQAGGERFFIEPKDDQALAMLQLAARTHRINNFNDRRVKASEWEKELPSLRTDFSRENLPILLSGLVEIPKEGEDTIPSPDRMEECLGSHPEKYSFAEE